MAVPPSPSSPPASSPPSSSGASGSSGSSGSPSEGGSRTGVMMLCATAAVFLAISLCGGHDPSSDGRPPHAPPGASGQATRAAAPPAPSSSNARDAEPSGRHLRRSRPVRLLIPNITGFLATTIPIAMSIGTAAGVNPLICGLAVMISGDAVLYYPAQSASSLAVYERGFLSAPEIFKFGVYMTLIAFVVVLAIAMPWWSFVGEPLTIAR